MGMDVNIKREFMRKRKLEMNWRYRLGYIIFPVAKYGACIDNDHV